MSIGGENLVERQKEWRGGSDQDLREFFWSNGDVVQAISSETFFQESFCVVFLSASFLLLLVFWLRVERRNGATPDSAEQQKTGRLPPGSIGWPLIGETVDFVVDGRKFCRTRREKYGSVFRSHLCGVPTVVVTGAENIQKVLSASESSLVHSQPSSFLKLFGRGALSSTVGKRHAVLQKSIVKLFTPRNLSMFVVPMQRVIREQVTKCGAARKVVRGTDFCLEMSLSIVCQCLFGFDLEPLEAERVNQLIRTFSDGVFAFPVDLPGFAFHKAMQARRGLRKFVVDRATSEAGRGGNRRLSILDILHSAGADNQEEFSNMQESIPDLIIELLFGANQSTASAMCTALIEISENREVLTRIRQELAEQGVSSGDAVDYALIKRLSYTNDVVKEVLRLQPPIAGAFRRTCKPFNIGEYVIPAGWMILYGITGTHETSSFFEEVDKFDPSRWKNVRLGNPGSPITPKTLDELNNNRLREPPVQSNVHQTTQLSTSRQDSEQTTDNSKMTSDHTADDAMTRNVSKFDYLPFGGGKRFCVGESMAKMILCIFLIELANCTKGWDLLNGRPEIKTAPIPFPADHLPILFSTHNVLRSNGLA